MTLDEVMDVIAGEHARGQRFDAAFVRAAIESHREAFARAKVEAEREACLTECEEERRELEPIDSIASLGARACAARIRKRIPAGSVAAHVRGVKCLECRGTGEVDCERGGAFVDCSDCGGTGYLPARGRDGVE